MDLRKAHPIKTVAIANIGEFYLPVYRYFPAREIRTWTEPSQAECDMSLFWCGDDKLVITPNPLDEEFVADVQDIMHYRNVHVVAPARTSGSICEDIVADSNLFTLLVETLRSSDNPQIISWGATTEFYGLLDRLRQENVKFRAPEIPTRENYWTVRYLDSKSGFRDFFISLSLGKQFRIPDGIICTDIEMTVQVANFFEPRNHGVVVKADNSVGGKGVLLLKPGRVRSQDIGAHILTSARLTPLLSAGIIVVEEYIESRSRSEIASPSVQAVVNDAGHTTVTGLAGQVIASDGVFLGAIIGHHIFPLALARELCEMAQIAGQAAAALGYCGVFNLDTVLGVDGHPYCVEMNARRTSVTYTLDLATHLLGTSFSDSVTIVTNERFSSRNLYGHSYDSVRSLLSPVLFPIKGDTRGVVITIPNSLTHFVRTPKIGFIAIGANFADARVIYAQACQLLSSKEL